MTTSKLPEWPEKPRSSGDYPADEWHDYWIDTTEAALARMEALLEVVTLWRKRMRHSMDDDDLQAVDDLLAACERGSAAQPSGAGRKEAGR